MEWRSKVELFEPIQCARLLEVLLTIRGQRICSSLFPTIMRTIN
jgi:hypothetical protein